MLALCLMLSKTYYAQNFAGIIGSGVAICTLKPTWALALPPLWSHHQDIFLSLDSTQRVVP